MRINLIILVICITFCSSCTSSKYTLINDQYTWTTKDLSGNYVRTLELHDIDSFEILNNSNYARDKKYVFFKGMKIESANPESFKVINNSGYSKDQENVFLNTDIIVLANPRTFKMIKTPYSRDENNVFCGNIPLAMDDKEVGEFKVTKSSSARVETSRSNFIEKYPQYKWLDTTKVHGIIIGNNGLGKTGKRKFKGIEQIID